MTEKRATGRHEYMIIAGGQVPQVTADLGALDASGWDVIGFSNGVILLRRPIKP